MVVVARRRKKEKRLLGKKRRDVLLLEDLLCTWKEDLYDARVLTEMIGMELFYASKKTPSLQRCHARS